MQAKKSDPNSKRFQTAEGKRPVLKQQVPNR